MNGGVFGCVGVFENACGGVKKRFWGKMWEGDIYVYQDTAY